MAIHDRPQGKWGSHKEDQGDNLGFMVSQDLGHRRQVTDRDSKDSRAL
jgi:hypothetical protein